MIRNPLLKPALVTGNQEAYAAIQTVLGVDTNMLTGLTEETTGGAGVGGGGGGARNTISSIAENSPTTLKYGYVGSYYTSSGMGSITGGDMGFYPSDFMSLLIAKPISSLYMLFNSGSVADSADNYIVSSTMLQKQMLASAEKYGGELIQGADGMYSKAIFENVDNNYTEVNIRRDDEYDLTSEVLGSSWWDKLWGITTTTTFDGIKAIYAVQDSDITGNISADCSNLYISEADYAVFSSFYMQHKTESTIYLFRYQVSDYISEEATLFGTTTLLGVKSWEKIDTNAYFFQEKVNLNFDIIDVTFEANDVETIIPVVMSPIDIIPSANSPVHTNSDKD